MSNVCPHGWLKRSCPICEKQEEIDRLSAELAEEKRVALYHESEASKFASEVQELMGELATFRNAVAHITEDGKTSRSFSTSEGWAMVHRDRLTDLEIAEVELETERLRLAACGAAALGHFDGCKDEYRSASLEDTLRLYDENKSLRAELAAMTQDRDEWKYSTIEANKRFKYAEKELAALKANQENVEATHRLTLREVQKELMRVQTDNDALKAQEPVRWVHHSDLNLKCCATFDKKPEESADYFIRPYLGPVPGEKQEPVAWTTKLAIEYGGFETVPTNIWGEMGVPLYAAPVSSEGQDSELNSNGHKRGCRCLSCMASKPATPQSSPEGYVLVPKEDLVALIDYWNGDNNETAMHNALVHIDAELRTMIAAAPEKK